jgi:hypothetical protein
MQSNTTNTPNLRNSGRRLLPLILAVVLLAALAAGMYWYWQTQRGGTEGAKTLTVAIDTGANQRSVEIHTDAEFLRQALEEQNLIKGEESAYGLFVKEVDGVAANDANQEWWMFTKGGEMLNTGVDDTPVADGDAMEIKLTVGYDG